MGFNSSTLFNMMVNTAKAPAEAVFTIIRLLFFSISFFYLIILIILLSYFSIAYSSPNPSCPAFVPSSTSLLVTSQSINLGYGSFPDISSACSDSASRVGSGCASPSISIVSSTSCSIQFGPDCNNWLYNTGGYLQQTTSCPVGYSQSGTSCLLSDASQISCPSCGTSGTHYSDSPTTCTPSYGDSPSTCGISQIHNPNTGLCQDVPVCNPPLSLSSDLSTCVVPNCPNGMIYSSNFSR